MSKRESDVGRIGGGWIAAAVGLSEYRSPLDAYQRIVGEVEDVLEGEAIDRGNFLEPALREWHRKKLETASTIIAPGTLHKRDPSWATYTPDGIVTMMDKSQRLAEYKSPGDDAAIRYGVPGTNQVPRDVGVQVHWGLFVTDLPRADVAALIGGELKLFNIERDPILEKELFDRAAFFMREYVAKKRPPPPTFSDSDTEWVKKRWKKDNGESLQWGQLTTEQRALVDRYIHVYLASKDLEKQLKGLENRVKEDVFKAATEVATIEGSDDAAFKRISWTSNERGAPKWKEVAELLATTFNLTPEKLVEIADATRGDPSRVFRPWFKRGQT